MLCLRILRHLVALLGTTSDIKKFDKDAVYAPARAGELFRSVLNAKKIKKEFGWKPRTSIKKGLKLTLKWYK